MTEAGDEIYHIVLLRRAALLVKRPRATWRELQVEFADYTASMGPHGFDEACEIIRDEWGDEAADAESVRGFPADPATAVSI